MRIIKCKGVLQTQGSRDYKFWEILIILLNQHGLFLIKGLLLAPSSTNYLLQWMPGLFDLLEFVWFVQG